MQSIPSLCSMTWGWSYNARIELLKLSVQRASVYSQRHTGGRGKLVLATWSIEKADWGDKEQCYPPRLSSVCLIGECEGQSSGCWNSDFPHACLQFGFG